MYPNGMLVQALNEKTSFIKHFPYYGIMAYHSFPLIGRTDEESRKLTDLQLFIKTENEPRIVNEFITDPGLFRRYTDKCVELQIACRVLLIESDYAGEKWEGS